MKQEWGEARREVRNRRKGGIPDKYLDKPYRNKRHKFNQGEGYEQEWEQYKQFKAQCGGHKAYPY